MLVGVLAKATFRSDYITQQNAAEALAAVLRVTQPEALIERGLRKLWGAAFAECAKRHDGIGRKYSQQLFLLLAMLVLRFSVVPPDTARFGDLLEWGVSAREAVVREAALKFAEALLQRQIGSGNKQWMARLSYQAMQTDKYPNVRRQA